MREIKFRAKSQDGTWFKWRLLDLIDMQTLATETVGQFTGLLDKSGKEIYEGDIVQSPLLSPFNRFIIYIWTKKNPKNTR